MLRPQPILTVRRGRDYALPVAFNSATGIGVLILKGEQPPRGYFCSQRMRASMVSMAGRAGVSSETPDPLSRHANPVSVCHPRLASLVAGLKPHSKEPIHG